MRVLGKFFGFSFNPRKIALLPVLFAGTAFGHGLDVVCHGTDMLPPETVSESVMLPEATAQADADRDGIADAFDPNPGVTNQKIVITPSASFGGADYTFTIHGSGRVASLQVSAALFDDIADGMSFAQYEDLSKKVYAHFQDVFDFLLFTSKQASPPSGTYFGQYYGAGNNIEGIGVQIYDRADDLGSAGKLQGVMHLTTTNGLRGGPSLHELMHRWGAYLDSIPSVAPSHWGWCSAGGQLGGWKPGTLQSLGGTSYRAQNPRGEYKAFGPNVNGGNGVPYGELELYVMGLIPATDVQAIQIANDFTPDANFSTNGTFTASSITTVPMSTIIAAEGPRKPDHTASQKSFRAMHVMIVKAPLTDAEWMTYDEDVRLFSLNGTDNTGLFNFWEATGGRATIKMDGLATVMATPTPTPVPTATPVPATPTPTPTATPIDPTPTPTVTPDPSATPDPTPASNSALANISTRLRVETGSNVLIGGFIVTGAEPKKIIVRAIGPSSGLGGALADPQLEIVNGSGESVAFNNNWQDEPGNRQQVLDTGIPPTNDLEAALVVRLEPGAYTAVVSGVNGGTGIGLVEAYDLDRDADSKLANIATRGLVQTGDDVLIGGLIIVGDSPQKIIIRAIGPSLAIDGKLGDPVLKLVNASGDVIAQNDDWRSDQEAEIIATTIPPSQGLESAIVTTLPAASYTAIVSGLNGGTGVGVVEVYALQ